VTSPEMFDRRGVRKGTKLQGQRERGGDRGLGAGAYGKVALWDLKGTKWHRW